MPSLLNKLTAMCLIIFQVVIGKYRLVPGEEYLFFLVRLLSPIVLSFLILTSIRRVTLRVSHLILLALAGFNVRDMSLIFFFYAEIIDEEVFDFILILMAALTLLRPSRFNIDEWHVIWSRTVIDWLIFMVVDQVF